MFNASKELTLVTCERGVIRARKINSCNYVKSCTCKKSSFFCNGFQLIESNNITDANDNIQITDVPDYLYPLPPTEPFSLSTDINLRKPLTTIKLSVIYRNLKTQLLLRNVRGFYQFTLESYCTCNTKFIAGTIPIYIRLR